MDDTLSNKPVDTEPTHSTKTAHSLPQPSTLWRTLPAVAGKYHYGYGRCPAFWFTLNCPYNYLYEFHRFQGNTACLHPTHKDSKAARFDWALNNPDIVCILHAIRVELLVRMVMPAILPHTATNPFQYWARFEEGYNGNPHAHGIAYADRNPEFENVMPDEDVAHGTPANADMTPWSVMEQEVTDYFQKYETENHPALYESGEPLYDFVIENLLDPRFAKPQTINLKDVLDRAFSTAEPNLADVKRLLIALIEDGQRHTFHGCEPPTRNMPCARKKPQSHTPTDVYCRYLYPRDTSLWDTPEAAGKGFVREDPYRKGLFNLLLPRNDPLLNNFETHLLLANLGNIDWRPLLNIWSVLEYLTKYTAKSGKPTKKLTHLFDEVISDICTHEKEDGQSDLWRRTIMKFYNRILGNRDYTLFEVCLLYTSPSPRDRH